MRKPVPFSTMHGLTLAKVEGIERGSDEVEFVTTCGRSFMLYHDQNCCEHVRIVDVVGDPSDLIGHPLLISEEREGSTPPGLKDGFDCFTWTFYTLATVKGYVDIRWLGESNGYYSERVDFIETTN